MRFPIIDPHKQRTRFHCVNREGYRCGHVHRSFECAHRCQLEHKHHKGLALTIVAYTAFIPTGACNSSPV